VTQTHWAADTHGEKSGDFDREPGRPATPFLFEPAAFVCPQTATCGKPASSTRCS